MLLGLREVLRMLLDHFGNSLVLSALSLLLFWLVEGEVLAEDHIDGLFQFLSFGEELVRGVFFTSMAATEGPDIQLLLLPILGVDGVGVCPLLVSV